MDFSIITPSFKQPRWLDLCLASVADQKGVQFEHIIRDNCSGKEVTSVVAKYPSAQLIQEPDQGMYDAVNKGLRQAKGDICAYLNCDEQYLPGALLTVAQFFKENPSIDVVFADTVVTHPDGSYLCSRQVIKPAYYHTKICHLGTLTAATFFRRTALKQHSLYFDSDLRDLGDAVWVLGLMEKKIPFAVLRSFTSSFTDTGENMNLAENAIRESEDLRQTAPAWARMLRLAWLIHHRLRRLTTGIYGAKSFEYDIFTHVTPTKRSHFSVESPTFIWKHRLSWSR